MRFFAPVKGGDTTKFGWMRLSTAEFGRDTLATLNAETQRKNQDVDSPGMSFLGRLRLLHKRYYLHKLPYEEICSKVPDLGLKFTHDLN
jgi:hypothetical protein